MEAGNLARAIIFSIRSQIDRAYWNANQRKFYDAPGEYGGKSSPPLGIPGMEWRPWYEPDDDDADFDKIGFHFEGVHFYWYKHLGRGLRVNTNWTADKWERWLDRAIQTIDAWEYARCPALRVGRSGNPPVYPDPARFVPLEPA